MNSDNTAFMIILAAIILLSLYYLFNNDPIHNDGVLQTKKSVGNNIDSENNDSNDSDDSDDSNDSNDSDSDSASDSEISENANLAENDSNDSDNSNDSNDSCDYSVDKIKYRSMGMNGPHYRKKHGNKYKHSSYRTSGSKNLDQLDTQFEICDTTTKSKKSRCEPIEDIDAQMGAPINFDNDKGTEKDKYNIDSFLPQEKEKDWFETIDPTETVNVKNSHLLNLHRPIGANTIGNTHRNAIYDIRGRDNAICPKFLSMPFNQTTNEPDRSMKSLSGYDNYE